MSDKEIPVKEEGVDTTKEALHAITLDDVESAASPEASKETAIESPLDGSDMVVVRRCLNVVPAELLDLLEKLDSEDK